MYTTCSELVVFIYWTGKSKNNLLSYCGLVDVRINASDKDLPVQGASTWYEFLESTNEKRWSNWNWNQLWENTPRIWLHIIINGLLLMCQKNHKNVDTT